MGRAFLRAGACALLLTTTAISTPTTAKKAPATATSYVAQPITAKERQQGTAANPDILKEFGGAYNNPPKAAYVERIGRKAAVQSGLSADPAQFDVTLLNSPINNAFAIPGGYIYTTRQLVTLMNDEAELAAVLGHEVGHVAARHGQKRQNAATRNSILGVLGQVLVGAVAGDSGIGQLLNKGIGTGVQLVTLGYSREQETEADGLAVQYLVSAGYDPMALSTMLASLAAQTDLDARISGNTRTTPEWASTHPDPAGRVRRAQTRASAANFTKGVRNRDAFLTAIDGMLYGDDPKQGMIDGRQFLHPELKIGFTAPQGFTMQNGTSAVAISGQGGQAQFSTAAYSGNLESYIQSVMQSLQDKGSALPTLDIRRTSVSGLPAAYVTLRGNTQNGPVDISVMAYEMSKTQAFHFVTVTQAGQGFGPFAEMVQSFRPLTTARAAAVKPRYLRVVRVASGDTVQSMAAKMAFSDYKLERFLVLNALTANSRLTAGQRVKIVTY